MRLARRFFVICGATALVVGALLPVLANGEQSRDPVRSATARDEPTPPLLSPSSCPEGELPLGAAAVARAALAALHAEKASDRPRLVNAGLADHGGPRGDIVRGNCGRRIWHRTVAVEIDLRKYHPSASLSERVSFVARTRDEYVVYALGH
jgi:hypothetical protein